MGKASAGSNLGDWSSPAPQADDRAYSTDTPTADAGAAQTSSLAGGPGAWAPMPANPVEAAARQRRLLVTLVRVSFGFLLVAFTLLGVFAANRLGQNVSEQLWWIPVLAGMALAVVAIGVDALTPVKKISTIIGVLVGVVLGLLATLAFSGLADLLLQSWITEQAIKQMAPLINSIKVLAGICFCYLGVITVLQTQDDFRLVIPYVEFAKQIRGVRPILLDTSVLIDGRIVDVAATNFVQAPLVIPRFVVGELQLLADSGEAMKRTKGRRGLDMIANLQRLGTVDVTIDETPTPGKAVDQMLVELARVMQAYILTTDVGLARVAAIQSVPVLNLNELSNATRASLVPGERVTVKLIREGEQHGQGVGYLPDGTMVVAENGGPRIGQVVTMTVTSSLQTSAGRLIFARLEEPVAPVVAPSVAPALGVALAPAVGQASAPLSTPIAADEPDAASPAGDAGPSTDSDSPVAGLGQPRIPSGVRPVRPMRGGTPRNPRR